MLKEGVTRLPKSALQESVSYLVHALKTRETTVQNTDFIINIKNPQGIWEPTDVFGLLGK